LLSQSYNIPQHGAAGIARLVELLQGADCYRLVFNDLGQAVERLEQLAEGSA
jgi:hypothetical protein